ncbi:MAG: hypothetical protein ACOCZM_02500 [Bacillota bacterium]
MEKIKIYTGVVEEVVMNFSDVVGLSVGEGVLLPGSGNCMIVAADFVYGEKTVLEFTYVIGLDMVNGGLRQYRDEGSLLLPEDTFRTSRYNLPYIREVECNFFQREWQKNIIKGEFRVEFAVRVARKREIRIPEPSEK